MKRQLDQYTHCGKLTRAILKFLCVLTTTVRSCATATSSDPPPYSQCNKDIMYYIIAGIPPCVHSLCSRYFPIIGREWY